MKTFKEILTEGTIKKYPFSMSKNHKVTFHDFETGKEIKNYEGPYYLDGDTKNIAYTWLEKGERNFASSKKVYDNRKK